METTGKQAWVSHKQAVPHCQSDVREPWSEPTHPLLPPPVSEAHCSQGNPLEDKSDHITPPLYIPWRPSSLRISSRLRSMAHESRAIQPHLILPATPFTPSSPPAPSPSFWNVPGSLQPWLLAMQLPLQALHRLLLLAQLMPVPPVSSRTESTLVLLTETL